MSFVQAAAPKRYDLIARLLHWLVVLLVIAQFVIGWTMPGVHRGDLPAGEVNWHLWVGVLLLLVMAVRVVWRITHRPPPAPKSLPAGLRILSTAGHHTLYLLLVITPVLGWLNASARGWTVSLFNLISLPALTSTTSSLGHALGRLHSPLSWVLLAVIVLHILAALYHRLVRKDQILARMI